jgi:hypothetical protein
VAPAATTTFDNAASAEDVEAAFCWAAEAALATTPADWDSASLRLDPMGTPAGAALLESLDASSQSSPALSSEDVREPSSSVLCSQLLPSTVLSASLASSSP